MWIAIFVVVFVFGWCGVDGWRLQSSTKRLSVAHWPRTTSPLHAFNKDESRDQQDKRSNNANPRGDGWKTLIQQLDKEQIKRNGGVRRSSPSSFSSSGTKLDATPTHSKVAMVKRSISSPVPITSLSSKLATAKALNIRDELQCGHFDVCSGCTVAGNFTTSTVVQHASRFFSLYNLQMKLHIDAVKGWRSHVKLAVQPMSKWGGMKIGLYQAHSHSVQAIPHCQVHHPRINEAVELLRLTAVDVGVKAYQEAHNNRAGRGSGELRYVQLSVHRSSNKVQLVLVWNADNYKQCSQALGRLLKKLKSQPIWHSVSINFNTGQSNAIFHQDEAAWKVLYGPAFIKETVGNATFLFKPQIFRQANLDAFETQVIPAITKSIPVGSKVSELYSGIGIIGLNVAKVASEVFCSDSNTYVDEVFDECVASLAEEDREKVYFDCMAADEAVQAGQCDAAEVVIVDPPRKGLSETVSSFFTNTLEGKPLPKELHRLIYVGCGFDAVERDTRLLVGSGLWKVKSADGFVLFPGTDHIETVVVYDRVHKH